MRQLCFDDVWWHLKYFEKNCNLTYYVYKYILNTLPNPHTRRQYCVVGVLWNILDRMAIWLILLKTPSPIPIPGASTALLMSDGPWNILDRMAIWLILLKPPSPIPIPGASTALLMSGRAPPYGNRANGKWIPRTPADFGDGGAFPEIHAAQYPLGMGERNEKKEKSNALALQVRPRVLFESVVSTALKLKTSFIAIL